MEQSKESSKQSLFMIIGFLLYSVIALAGNDFTLGYDGSTFSLDYAFYGYGLIVLSILIGIAFWFYFWRKCGFRNNYFFLICVGVCFLGNTLALSLFPSVLKINDSFTYNLNSHFRIFLIFAYLSLSIFIYNFYAFFPLLKKNRNSFSFILELIVIIAIASIFVSYITDFNDYVALFRGNESFISSFYGHKNVFGLILLFGLMAEMFLFELDKAKWRIVPVIYIFVSLCVLNAKSALLASIVLIFGYILYVGLTNFRTRKKLSISCFAIFLLFAVASIALLLVPIPNDDGLFSSFLLTCRSIFSNGENSTVGTRYIIYKKLFDQLKLSSTFLMFGFGDTNFQYSFAYAIDSSSPDAPIYRSWPSHNGFLECLARGGVLRLVIYGLVLVYLIYKFIKKYKTNKNSTIFLSLIAFFPFLIRTMAEYEYLFLEGWKGLVFAFFIVVPILSNEKEEGRGFEISFVFDAIKSSWQFIFSICGSALLCLSLLLNKWWSFAFLLPLGLILLTVFAFLYIKKNKILTIWTLCLSFLIDLAVGLGFGLCKSMPLLGLLFAPFFGSLIPFLSYMFYLDFDLIKSFKGNKEGYFN